MGSRSIAPIPTRTAGVQLSHPSLSANGKWLAYVSNEGEGGRNEVYVAPSQSVSERRKVSTRGGDSPLWTRGGREIVYHEPVDLETGHLMSVAFVPVGTLPIPVHLFTKSIGDFAHTTPLPGYAVTDDGERFLAVVRDRSQYPPPVTIDVVFHWLDTLPERLRGSR